MKKETIEQFCEKNNQSKDEIKIYKGRVLHSELTFKVGDQIGYFFHKDPNFDILYFYRTDLHHINLERIKSVVSWRETKDNIPYWNESITYDMRLIHIHEFSEMYLKFHKRYDYFYGRENFDHIYKAFLKTLLMGKELDQHPNIKEIKKSRFGLKVSY